MSTNLPTVIFFDLGDTLTYLDSNGQLQRYNDTLDTLQILQERGYRLGLISNQSAGTSVDSVSDILESLGLRHYISYDLITISTEILNNNGKPNRPIFDLALQKAGHSAGSDQSIFVTETFSHIQAARSYGWRAILKRNFGTCQPSEGECVSGLLDLLNLLPALANIKGTNLHLAPNARMIDGLWAVPMDIHHISATLTFDGASQAATGDATIDFKLGHNAGNPIFDLRQTINNVWLDGSPLTVAKVAHHDFGGGIYAELRILEQVLSAGSNHSLRLAYTLGPPQASNAGSYLPVLNWTIGPRLTLNFGFTDMGAGRYLESWVPSNLIFDQFELKLELQLLNTNITHQVITNGLITILGANHWIINFPKRFTSLSPLLELHPLDSLAGSTDSVILPVSGNNVTIETWKLPNDPGSPSRYANLSTEAGHIRSYLIDNEISTGPYIHGNRFVAFLHKGGMEYEGGATTGIDASRHETFHSWWARGVKPASQPDAWFDEAWTVYYDNGHIDSQPFNFTDSPVMLCPLNQWIRTTSELAYTEGYRFWKGIAALIGVSQLNSFMSEFYKQRYQSPVTTMNIEEFLVCQTGNTQLVDAFHRFVYGFGNTTPPPDLWLHDDLEHHGSDLWAGRFWDSPDLWIRNKDDGGTEHQPPEYGQDNWFYARVHNRGTTMARHFVVVFNVKQYAGTQFVYSNDFLPCIAAVAGFELAPGTSRIMKARWPKNMVPAPGVHACMLAAVLAKGDQPIVGRQVRDHNNLAQKNLTVFDLVPGYWFSIPFVVSNLQSIYNLSYQLELHRPEKFTNVEVSLVNRNKSVFKPTHGIAIQPFNFKASYMAAKPKLQLDCGGYASETVEKISPDFSKDIISILNDQLLAEFDGGAETTFNHHEIAHIPVRVGKQEQLTFGLRVQVPEYAKKGDTILLDLVQKAGRKDRICGGIAIKINVI